MLLRALPSLRHRIISIRLTRSLAIPKAALEWTSSFYRRSTSSAAAAIMSDSESEGYRFDDESGSDFGNVATKKVAPAKKINAAAGPSKVPKVRSNSLDKCPQLIQKLAGGKKPTGKKAPLATKKKFAQ